MSREEEKIYVQGTLSGAHLKQDPNLDSKANRLMNIRTYLRTAT